MFIHLEIVYIVSGLGLLALLIFVLFTAIQFFKREEVSPVGISKKFKYDFYLLREQYQEILNEAREYLTRTELLTTFESKMKLLEKAQKTTLRGLSFFLDNQDGQTILLKIADKKRVYINDETSFMKKELAYKKSRMNSKKYQGSVSKALDKIKKLEKKYPQNNLWKDFYNEISAHLTEAKLQAIIHESTKSIFKHEYKLATKHINTALTFLSSLDSIEKKTYAPMELRLNNILNKVQERQKIKEESFNKAA